MSGEDWLREGAEVFRAAASRSRTGPERDHLLDCAADLAQIADWIAANRVPRRDRGVELREFHAGENGDRWHLAHEAPSARVFVRHQANLPSGGHVTDLELADFLSGPSDSPERAALTQLIGVLVRRGK